MFKGTVDVIMFKGTVDVISSEPPFKEVNVRLTTYPINF